MVTHVNPACGAYSTANTGDDQTFTQLANQLWEANDLYNKDPSDTNMELIMQAVTALNGYFSTHTPTGSDQLTLYNDITNVPFGGASLATLCGYYSDPAHAQEAVTALKADARIAKLYKDNTVGWSTSEQGNTQLKTDVNNLYDALYQFDELEGSPGNHQATLEFDAQLIAKYMAALNTDFASTPAADGVLRDLQVFLNTSVTPGGPTLKSLVDAVNSSPTAANEDALIAALNTNFGEGVKGNFGGFGNLLAEIKSLEHW